MSVKCTPIPRLRLDRIRLNPTIHVETTAHTPANYEMTTEGIDYVCPHCGGTYTLPSACTFKRVYVGVYALGVFFHDCPLCKKPLVSVSARDIIRNWER